MENVKRKDRKPDLSVIIISFNTKRITVDCLTSLFASLQGSQLEIEVLVVDNASTDGSIEELERMQKNHPSIELIKNKDNVGFGKANNMAVDKAKSDYILLLNSDIIVQEKAVEKLLTYYKTHEKTIQFLGGKLLNADMTDQPSAGRFFTLPVVFAFLFLKGDAAGLTRSSPNTPVETDWVSGACILTKKTFFQKLKGFDEGIFMYMEEVDLLYRAKMLSLNTYFYPEARFIHLGSASSGKTYPILQVYRGLLYLYGKHYGSFARMLLKGMLQLKALIAYGVGIFTNNSYLKTTYGEALKIAQMAR